MMPSIPNSTSSSANPSQSAKTTNPRPGPCTPQSTPSSPVLFVKQVDAQGGTVLQDVTTADPANDPPSAVSRSIDFGSGFPSHRLLSIGGSLGSQTPAGLTSQHEPLTPSGTQGNGESLPSSPFQAVGPVQAGLVPEPPTNAAPTYTAGEIEWIGTIQSHFEKNYPPNGPQYWSSPGALFAAVRKDAESFGFLLSRGSNGLFCSRRDRFKSEQERTKKLKAKTLAKKCRTRQFRSNLRCGCHFFLRVSYVRRNGNFRLKYPDAPQSAVRITTAEYRHGQGCMPSSSQLTAQKQRSGFFAKKALTQEKMKGLIELARHGPLSNRTIRSFVASILPPCKGFNANSCFNLRVRIQRYIDADDEQGTSMTTNTAASILQTILNDQENDAISTDSCRVESLSD